MVELAPDETRRQGDRVEVDSGSAADGRIDGDAQRAATEFKVVEVELEVTNDGRNQRANLVECLSFTHRGPPFVLRSSYIWPFSNDNLGPFSKEGVGHESPRL